VLKLSCIMHAHIFMYVAVHESKQCLLAAGFKELKESDHWTIKPSDKVVYNCAECGCETYVYVSFQDLNLDETNG
jgi:aspartyl aminopeptidase